MEQIKIPQNYKIPPRTFDDFNPDLSTQRDLGSKRGKEIQEVSEIRSTNFRQSGGIITQGWRLTRRGLEIAVSSGTFPPGTIQFVDIVNINTAKILGRATAGSGVIEELSASSVKTILALVASDIGGFDEGAQDAVGSILSAEFTYNDGAPSISINTIATSKITNFAEAVEDVIGGILTDSNTIDFTYNDGGDSISAEVKDTFAKGDVYSPTRSAEANLDSNVTLSQAQYMRVGNTVTVSGRFTADPTLAATATSFEMTLPIASNIGAVEDVAGVAFCGNIAGMGAEITGSVANNTAVISWKASDITSQSWSYTFSYQII